MLVYINRVHTYIVDVGSPRWNGECSIQLLCKGQSTKEVSNLIPRQTHWEWNQIELCVLPRMDYMFKNSNATRH